ncbi:MAG: peptidylprolyl isomerase, partial [Bacteroidetes bacterium]
QDANTAENSDTHAEINPVIFNFGTNILLPAFEKNLMGLSSGDSFDFVIKADDAYGPVDSYAVFDIPLDTFEVDGKIDEKMIQKGNIIPMTDNEGQKHLGKIITILKDAVTMDFNHPLAGKDLRFTGKVIEVKL